MLTIGRKRKPIDILRDVLLLVHEEVRSPGSSAARRPSGRSSNAGRARLCGGERRAGPGPPRPACLPLRLRLSERDSKRVQALLQHPPKPHPGCCGPPKPPGQALALTCCPEFTRKQHTVLHTATHPGGAGNPGAVRCSGTDSQVSPAVPFSRTDPVRPGISGPRSPAPSPPPPQRRHIESPNAAARTLGQPSPLLSRRPRGQNPLSLLKEKPEEMRASRFLYSPGGAAPPILSLGDAVPDAGDHQRKGRSTRRAVPRGRAEMEPFVDIQAAAAYLSVKISWVYEQVRLARMPSSKVGHRRRFRLSELEAWVRGSRGTSDPLLAQQGSPGNPCRNAADCARGEHG